MAKKLKIAPKSYLFVGVVMALLIIYTLMMFIMVYLAVNTSLKEYIDFKLNPKFDFPEKLYFKNYVDAFTAFKVTTSEQQPIYLLEMLINSIIFSGGCAIVTTIVPCLIAYLVSKYKEMWFNRVIYTTVIVAMILPIIGALPSEIQMAKALGLYNTRFGLIVMRASYLGMYFLIFHGTFNGLSDEYIEAATIDGASQMNVLLNIVLPLVKTTIFAVLLLNFISFWNEYQSPLIYMADFPTAAVGLFKFVYFPNTAGAASSHTIQMAGCMILFIPIFVLFLCFKDIFMGNLTVGGIKG